MTSRRVLKPRPGEGGQPGSLELGEGARLDPAPGEVAVDITAALLDPLALVATEGEARSSAGFCGLVAEVGPSAAEHLRVGQVVVGTGPLADAVTVPESDLDALPPNSRLSAKQAATIPYLASIERALAGFPIKPGSRVIVAGRPALRRLTAQLLTASCPDASITGLGLRASQETESDGRFDALIHALGDPAELDSALSALRHDGEALLLVPPGRQVLALDFYPHVHRTCVRMVARRVEAQARTATGRDAGYSRLARLLRQRRLDVEAAPFEAWDPADQRELRLAGIARAGKLLTVSWRAEPAPV